MTKRLTLGGAVLMFLVTILLVGFLGNVTNGFQDFDKDTIIENTSKKVNPDNLYTVECVELVDKNDGSGIVVDVNEKNGAIVLNGTASEDTTYVVGNITLDKGTYTLSAIKGASRSTVYMTATVGANSPYYFDFTPGNTIEISEDDTSVELKIVIAKDCELDNVQVLPVIVSGDEIGDFYK